MKTKSIGFSYSKTLLILGLKQTFLVFNEQNEFLGGLRRPKAHIARASSVLLPGIIIQQEGTADCIVGIFSH